jgi:hypothetical protein
MSLLTIGVIDVIDTGAKLPPVSLTPVNSLQPVSLTLVVNIEELLISLQTFKETRNGCKLDYQGPGGS